MEAQLAQQVAAESQTQSLSLSKKLKLVASGGSTSGCYQSCCRLRQRRRARRPVEPPAQPTAAASHCIAEQPEAAPAIELEPAAHHHDPQLPSTSRHQ